MELVNADQLACTGCQREAFETASGWVHRDGSDLLDCGAAEPAELAAAFETVGAI